MMNFLALCGADSKAQPLWNIIGTIVNIIMIGVPIALIIWGMIDLGKAVIASKEEEVKKATKLLGKRFLYAIGVFAMVWLVTFILDTVATTANSGVKENEVVVETSDWSTCWKCNIRKGGKNCSEGTTTGGGGDSAVATTK